MNAQRKLAALLIAGALSFTVFSVSIAGDKTDITICHRTASQTHPYEVNSPSIDSNGYPDVTLQGGHIDHTGPIWPSTGPDGKWGDIIPPFTYLDFSFPGYNWTSDGQAIYNNDCKVPGEPTEAPSLEPTEAPSFEQTQADTTDIPSEAPSFGQTQADITECPCDTADAANTSHPADGAWLLVVALGVLLASLVVVTPGSIRWRRSS